MKKVKREQKTIEQLEREHFEGWWQSWHVNFKPDDLKRTSKSGAYNNVLINDCWMTWQAARATLTPSLDRNWTVEAGALATNSLPEALRDIEAAIPPRGRDNHGDRISTLRNVLTQISERLVGKAFPLAPHGEAEGCVTLTDLHDEFRAAIAKGEQQ